MPVEPPRPEGSVVNSAATKNVKLTKPQIEVLEMYARAGEEGCKVADVQKAMGKLPVTHMIGEFVCAGVLEEIIEENGERLMNHYRITEGGASQLKRALARIKPQGKKPAAAGARP